MVVQQSQFVEFLIDDLHYGLWNCPFFESLSELLLNSFLILLF